MPADYFYTIFVRNSGVYFIKMISRLEDVPMVFVDVDQDKEKLC